MESHSFNGAQLCSDYCSVITFRVWQPNVGAKREVDPVNGFQIISYLADADAVKSPRFTAASEYTGHCIGLSHTVLTGLAHGGYSPLCYLAIDTWEIDNSYSIVFISCQIPSKAIVKQAILCFLPFKKMAVKHDSITKQSYILRLFVPFLITKLRVVFKSMSMLYFT